MAVLNQKRKSIPWLFPVAHGLFAAGGILLLVVLLLTANPPIIVWVALGLFLMAAVGGGIIFKSYLRKEHLPTGMIIIHGMLGLMGLLFLISFLYAQTVMDKSASGTLLEQRIIEE